MSAEIDEKSKAVVEAVLDYLEDKIKARMLILGESVQEATVAVMKKMIEDNPK